MQKLANYTTQRTYFSSRFASIPSISEEELQNFLTQWILDTDEAELERIHVFTKAKRRHYSFKEGDFFHFPIDLTHYGYGQILLDVHKMGKEGEPFWDILMGRPLIVSVCHIITENPSMDMKTLKNLKSCPSQFIMDNRFYYGEYKIIGHGPLSEHTDYPIMYGLSISMKDKDKIIHCINIKIQFSGKFWLKGNCLQLNYYIAFKADVLPTLFHHILLAKK